MGIIPIVNANDTISRQINFLIMTAFRQWVIEITEADVGAA